MKKLLLLDGNSMLFRAFYATIYTRPMKTSTNIPTNAIYAFALMLNKAISLVKPDAMLVAWDSGKPTFRHELTSEYKATRKQLPQELVAQFPIARAFLEAANIYQYEQVGIEADDIIGSVAKQLIDYDVTILSSDKDLLQLIDDRITVMLMKKGMSEIEAINAPKLMEWMNVTPSQIIDLKALMGDTADNIKGVAGIGEKTAIKFIHEFETIEHLYENIDKIKGKQQERLIEGKESAFLSKKLATIITDANIKLDSKALILNQNIEALNQFYRQYEMNSLIQEVATKSELQCKVVKKVSTSLLNENTFILPQYDNEHYLDKKLIALTVGNHNQGEIIAKEDILKDEKLLQFFKTNTNDNFRCKNSIPCI